MRSPLYSPAASAITSVNAKEYYNTTQAATINATTTVPLNASAFSNGGITYSAGAFTVPVAGVYHCIFLISFTSITGATAQGSCSWSQTGSFGGLIATYNTSLIVAAFDEAISCDALINCAANDTLTPQYFLASGITAATIDGEANGRKVYASLALVH